MRAVVCSSCDDAFLVVYRGPLPEGFDEEQAADGLDELEPPQEIICPACAEHDGDLGWLGFWRLVA